jgi:tetratricopeptide (TPR) repeat protein
MQNIMSKLITLIALFLSVQCIGQATADRAADTAFEYYWINKFDSALYYYQKVDLFSSDRKSYFNAQIGKCYKGMGKVELAKASFVEAIKDSFTIKRIYFGQRAACHQLVDIFMAEGNYSKALEYLKLAERKYPHFRVCGNGEFERMSTLKYKFAQCYEKLNQLDTAIAYMTPYVFAKTEDVSLDSLDYINTIEYYYTMLKQKYSECELKSSLYDALQRVYYKKAFDFESYRIDPKYKFYNVECYIEFLGTRITLVDVGYEANSWGEEPILVFTKDYLLQYFTKTPLYKMIQN